MITIEYEATVEGKAGHTLIVRDADGNLMPYLGQSVDVSMTVAFGPETGEYFIDHSSGIVIGAYRGLGYLLSSDRQLRYLQCPRRAGWPKEQPRSFR